MLPRAARPAPAIPVTVATAETKDVPIIVRGIGTVQAYKSVTIKARVDGQIVKITFERGPVRSRPATFSSRSIPQPFQAALDHAAAAKRRDEAQLAGAQPRPRTLRQADRLGFPVAPELDQQQASVDALMGTVALDEAAVDTAGSISYTDIRAPIDGRTGQRLVDLGNMVQAPATAWSTSRS